MTGDSDNLKLEKLLAEWAEADRAGVFRETPVEVSALLAAEPQPQPERRADRWRKVLVGLELAACLGLVVGLATVFRTGNPLVDSTAVTDGSVGVELANVAITPTGDPARFADCFSGPASQPANGVCEAVDYDHDGDVDLADFGAFQLAYNSTGG